MISRIKRLVWSLDVMLSMGVAFVPLGCESSGPYTSVLPSHRGASVLPLRTPILPLHRGTSAFATHGGDKLAKRVVDALSDCVKQAPAPSTSAEGHPRTYSIHFDAHVTEDGGVSSVEVRDSMLGGGGMEACLSGVLRGANLPVRAQATQHAPEARGLMAVAPAAAAPVAAAPFLEAAAPAALNPVVLVGVGFIVVVAVTIYIVTKDDNAPDCKQVKEYCIKFCSDTILDRGIHEPHFSRCMRKCMADNGC